MDLEPQILDLDRMGQIAFILAQQTEAERIELLYFAVDRFAAMAADLKEAYELGLQQSREEEA